MSYDELLPKCEYVDPYCGQSCGHPASRRDPRGPAYCAKHWQEVDATQLFCVPDGQPGPRHFSVVEALLTGVMPQQVDAVIADFERQMEGR